MTSTRTHDGSADDLAAARREIERVDQSIVRLIRRRMQIAAVVASSKRAAGLPILDPEQEARVIRRAAEWAREAALPEEDVRHLFWRIVALTRRAQDERP